MIVIIIIIIIIIVIIIVIRPIIKTILTFSSIASPVQIILVLVSQNLAAASEKKNPDECALLTFDEIVFRRFPRIGDKGNLRRMV